MESRRTSQEKAPWKNIESLNGPIEKQFLRELLLGESIAPFRILKPALAVIPWDRKSSAVLDAKAAQAAGYGNLARWMKQAEALWNQHAHRNGGDLRMSLIGRLDYQRGLSAQMPPAKLRVLCSASGTLAAATILKDQAAIVEHKLCWAAFEDENEARYITAILNSDTLRARVAPHQSKGQWGARDFDKLLVNGPIPKFDPGLGLHRELVAAADEAGRLAADVRLPEGIHFIRARQHIRQALRDAGIAGRMELLVTKLFGGTRQ
ncbi:MAG: hypothetical protein ACREP6_12470 [Candidatus Binataceae bacterium]